MNRPSHDELFVTDDAFLARCYPTLFIHVADDIEDDDPELDAQIAEMHRLLVEDDKG